MGGGSQWDPVVGCEKSPSGDRKSRKIRNLPWGVSSCGVLQTFDAAA